MFYKRITHGLNDPGFLIPESELVINHVNHKKDCYESLFLYNDEQFVQFKETGSVAGIQDVIGKKLYWDFDSKTDLEKAKNDALELLARLEEQGFDMEKADLFFSGNKGFGVEITLENEIFVKEFKKIVFHFADDLETFDRVINNPSRVIRIPNTKHQESKLYKIALNLEDIPETAQILGLARFPGRPAKNSSQKMPVFSIRPPSERKIEFTQAQTSLDFSNKPKDMSNCRWALQNGFFKDGSRSTALLAMASYYKNKGMDLELTYRLLKGVAELQTRKNGGERFPDEEIYNNIILQVYSEAWKNGQYSCREPGNFLYDYCKNLGTHRCNHEKDDQLKPKTMIDVKDSFKTFVKNIDKNTIITGIDAIDQNFFLCTGSNVGLLGAPASGKTALALNILNNTSKQGVKSVFASLDMHRNRMFEKVMYKVTGLSRAELYHKVQMDQDGPLYDKVREEFGNVYFLNKSAPTVSDVRDYVLACQETCGEKIKLVMVDYFERISSEMSEDTAASKRVAGELQDLVNDLDVCLITLVQPNKASIHSGPDAPLYSYSGIKGSAFVSQAFRQILSIWRPFATPALKDDDRYMQLAILKNDLGELGEFVFGWNGKRGLITELDDRQKDEFERLLERKESDDDGDDW